MVEFLLEAHEYPKLVPEDGGSDENTCACSSTVRFDDCRSQQAEGRRMIVFTLYAADNSTASTATTTVIDFSTQVACREARDELRRNAKAPGFGLYATCVEP
jgi:hypothetical protein